MANKEDLKAILEQVGKLQLSIGQVNNRIDKLEHNNIPAPAEGVNASATINNTPDQRSIDNPTPIRLSDIQADFNKIRDSLLCTGVPDGFRVHDSQVGIKQEAKGALKILSVIREITSYNVKPTRTVIFTSLATVIMSHVY